MILLVVELKERQAKLVTGGILVRPWRPSLIVGKSDALSDGLSGQGRRATPRTCGIAGITLAGLNPNRSQSMTSKPACSIAVAVSRLM